ncbi:MAG: hypothetical protein MUF48_24225 [Pirellulaceae bacterium]|nr:hypothetical protein [Pirellulaceae bacterium]
MRPFLLPRVLLPLFLVVAVAPASPSAETSNDSLIRLPVSYVELYERIFQQELQSGKPGLGESAALSHLALKLWLRTHDLEYRQQAERLFRRTLADPQFSLKDFHVLHHFGELALRMKEQKLIPAEQTAQLRKIATEELEAFCRSEDWSDNNIRIGQVAGYAGLFGLLKDEPFAPREAVRRHLDDYWSRIAATGDLDEDASNYDSLGLAFLVDLARLLGRERDLAGSAGFRRQFERFRDIVSPAGLIPEYGDSYFDYSSCPLDRVYLLEYAAQLYGDPTFLFAARRLYGRPQTGLPDLDLWSRALPLIDLEASSAEARRPAGPPSLVTWRARRGSPCPLVDKMILRSGLEPGAAMVLLDLYASGSHSHPQKGPSIAYYEVDQVPLFHNLGRHHTRSAIAGNLLWAQPAERRFPGCWNREGEWFTMRLLVDALHQDVDGKYVLAGGMSLRDFPEWNRNCRFLDFDNLRLAGPFGTRLIDSFDAPDGWDRRLLQSNKVVTCSDRTQGDASQRIPWNTAAASGRRFSEPLPAPFTKEQYSYLELDLKYEGARPYLHVRGLGEQVDLGDQSLSARLTGASVEQRQHDAYGRIRYEDYIQPGTKLTRQMVLAAEGYLLVRDELAAGPSMDGWNAGQLWQFYDLGTRKGSWFAANDDGAYPTVAGSPAATTTRSMLARFLESADTRIDVEEVKQRFHMPNPKGRKPTAFFTAYSQRRVRAGRCEVFALLVVPRDPAGATPDEFAARTTIVRGADGLTKAEVVGPSGTTVTIVLSPDGWEVKR